MLFKIWEKKKKPSFFTKLFDKRILMTTFDTYDYEFKNISTPSLNLGNKFEITKSIGKHFQITGIITKFSKQYFATIFRSKTLFQIGFEPYGNYQLKLRNTCCNFTNTYHAVINDQREIFTQIESIYNSQFYNIVFKLIKPAFETTNCIYIFNYWKSFGKLSTGFEIVHLDSHIGVGFSGRFVDNTTVTCINLQRFNLLKISLYKRLSQIIDLGIEIQNNLNKKKWNFLAGIRVKTEKSEIKWCINDVYNMGFSWEEQLTSKLKIGLSGEYNFIDFEYGLSFIYDD